MIERVDIPNHLGDRKYGIWELFAAETERTVLQSITEYNEYINELQRDNYFTAIVNHDYCGETSFYYIDYSKEGKEQFIANGADNHVLEHNGHYFTADFQRADKSFVRYDGELLAEADEPEQIMVVYDDRLDTVVDTIAIKEKNKGEREILRGLDMVYSEE